LVPKDSQSQFSDQGSPISLCEFVALVNILAPASLSPPRYAVNVLFNLRFL
jgi:hypothetical protein